MQRKSSMPAQIPATAVLRAIEMRHRFARGDAASDWAADFVRPVDAALRRRLFPQTCALSDGHRFIGDYNETSKF